MRALCLAGPTASGKTAAALAIANALPAEIVSVDSAQVYRGMDIGTAKPSTAERSRVPHHLIDIVDPADAYSAARFVADAAPLIAEINARGNVAVLAGGTMLYFKALLDGIDVLPGADRALRDEIDRDAAARGWPALHRCLAKVDPASAARIAPGDAQRIQRALEVFRATGKPLSAWHASGGRARLALPIVALEPRDRAWLHRRIEERFVAMLERGLLDEVRALRARGDLDAGMPSMRSVGYRQAWDALETGRIDALLARGVAATRQLAKRQLTWLRGMASREALACDAADATAQAVACALRLVRG